VDIEKEVFIPMRVPSLNVLDKKNWRRIRKTKIMPWRDAIGFMVGRGNHNEEWRCIKITDYCVDGRDEYDYDNFVGGCKRCVVDSLKHFGWIKDDKAKWFSGIYRQKRVGEDGTKEIGTMITIFGQELDVTFDEQNGITLNYCKKCYKRIFRDYEELSPQNLMGGTGKEEVKCCRCKKDAHYAVRVELWKINVKEETTGGKETTIQEANVSTEVAGGEEAKVGRILLQNECPQDITEGSVQS
jgi:hypothetical protein